MAHDCPACGMACYCDGDDTWMESAWALAHCRHDCDPEEDEFGSFDDDDDQEPEPAGPPHGPEGKEPTT